MLLVPQRSSIRHRGEANTTTSISFNKYSGKSIQLTIPIIAANMDTIAGETMADAMSAIGAAAFIHRYQSPGDVTNIINYLLNKSAYPIIPTIGIDAEAASQAAVYLTTGAHAICIDVAHAHSDHTIELTEKLSKQFPEAHIIVGNIGTESAARDLIQAGATGLKIGIGPGLVCLTRQQTGCGVSQLEAIKEIRQYIMHLPITDRIPIIADGGMRYSGDIVKALAAGADAVMSGYFFAGCRESEAVVKGELRRNEDGSATVSYRGMSSHEAQNKWKGHSKNIEGRNIEVPSKGSVETIVQNLLQGVQSGMSYCGSGNIQELHVKARFRSIHSHI